MKDIGTPPSVPTFTRLDANTGYYIYTGDSREGYVNNSDKPFFDKKFMKTPMTLDQIEEASLIVPTFSFEAINTYISQLCFKFKKQCSEAAVGKRTKNIMSVVGRKDISVPRDGMKRTDSPVTKD
jgi:hypothetical protein